MAGGTFNGRYTRDEVYTVEVQSGFYAGLLAAAPDLLSDFADSDIRGGIHNGLTVMIDNTFGATRTLYVAVPTSHYTAGTFELTTMGYPIRLTEVSVIEEHQILSVAMFEPGDTLTFVVEGVT